MPCSSCSALHGVNCNYKQQQQQQKTDTTTVEPRYLKVKDTEYD